MKRVLLTLVLVLVSLSALAQGDVVITADTAVEIVPIAYFGPGRVVDATISPNGKLIGIASTAGIKLYETGAFGDADTLGYQLRFYGNAIAFHPDGKKVTALAYGYNMQTFDVDTGDALVDIYPDDTGGSLGTVTYSPDGSFYALSAGDTLNVYLENGTRQFQSTGHASTLSRIVFSPDGTRIATSSWDGSIKVWNAADGSEIMTLLGHTDAVTSVDYDDDGEFLVTSSIDGTVRLWDAVGGAELATLITLPEGFGAAVFSPDGDYVAVGGIDGSIRLIDIETRQSGPIIGMHSELIHALDFSPDGAMLMSASDGLVQLWDLTTLGLLGAAQFEPAFTTLAVSTDGSQLAAGGKDGRAMVFDALSGEILSTFSVGTPPITGLAFTLENPTLYIASGDNEIPEFDLGTQEQVGFLDGTYSIVAITSHPTISMINAVMADGALRWWGTDTGVIFGTTSPHNGMPTATSFSPDGIWMASADAAGEVFVWNVESGDVTGTLDNANARINDLAFSYNGEYAAAALEDARIAIWQLATPADPVLEIGGLFDSVTAIAFSRDDSIIAAVSRDTTLRLFDVQTGQQYNLFYDHNSAVLDVAFSPDGTRLYTVGEDGVVIVWAVP